MLREFGFNPRPHPPDSSSFRFRTAILLPRLTLRSFELIPRITSTSLCQYPVHSFPTPPPLTVVQTSCQRQRPPWTRGRLLSRAETGLAPRTRPATHAGPLRGNLSVMKAPFRDLRSVLNSCGRSRPNGRTGKLNKVSSATLCGRSGPGDERVPFVGPALGQ